MRLRVAVIGPDRPGPAAIRWSSSSRVPEPGWRLTKRSGPFPPTAAPARERGGRRRAGASGPGVANGCRSACACRARERAQGAPEHRRRLDQPRHMEAGDPASAVEQAAQRLLAAGEAHRQVQAARRLRRGLQGSARRGRGRRRVRAPRWQASSASANTRCSSRRSASTCGVMRTRAWRSAQSSRSANGVRRARLPWTHSTSGLPSTDSQCLSEPQTWRYDCPDRPRDVADRACSSSAESRSNSGFSISAPSWPRAAKV